MYFCARCDDTVLSSPLYLRCLDKNIFCDPLKFPALPPVPAGWRRRRWSPSATKKVFFPCWKAREQATPYSSPPRLDSRKLNFRRQLQFSGVAPVFAGFLRALMQIQVHKLNFLSGRFVVSPSFPCPRCIYMNLSPRIPHTSLSSNSFRLEVRG